MTLDDDGTPRGVRFDAEVSPSMAVPASWRLPGHRDGGLFPPQGLSRPARVLRYLGVWGYRGPIHLTSRYPHVPSLRASPCQSPTSSPSPSPSAHTLMTRESVLYTEPD